MRLQDKVAIVTGAGAGIGRGIAEAFAREGAKQVLVDWSAEGGEATLQLLQSAGADAIFVQADMSQAEDVQRLVDACIQRYRRVDILVNNAGILKVCALHKTSEQDWDSVIDVNLKSVFLACRAALPKMIEQGKGKIINIASIAGLVGFDGIGPYCASKGGMIALTRSMALDYSRRSINVNCIAPGVIRTNMTAAMLEDPAALAGFVASTPYPRLGLPEDIAMATVYLASDESDFVCGAVLTVDGGWTIR